MRNFMVIFLILCFSVVLSAEIVSEYNLIINGTEQIKIKGIGGKETLLLDHKKLCEVLEARVYVSDFNKGLTTIQGNYFSVTFPKRKAGIVNAKVIKFDTMTQYIDGVLYSPIDYLGTLFNAEYYLNESTIKIDCEIPAHIFEYPERVKEFVNELEKNDFIVQPGNIAQAQTIDYYAIGYVPDCNGNNATNPYLLLQIPPAPEQKFSNNFPWAFKIREDEAIILMGMTPPECVYYSYRTYLLNRYYEKENTRKKLFASLGDTINNYNINYGVLNDQVYERPIILISTANKLTDQIIRSVALTVGIHEFNIFTDIIPVNYVRLGLEENCDELFLLHRTALYEDQETKEQFLNNPTYVVLRVTPVEKLANNFFKTPELKQRGSGWTESQLLPVMEKLEGKIIEKYNNYEYDVLNTTKWLIEGYEAIQNGIDVIGEVRDTLYLKSENFKLGDEEEFLVVFGVNHNLTGKAIYTNFSIYGDVTLNGLGGITNFMYAGTAEEFLPDEPLAKYLYVWKVARSEIYGENCLIVPNVKKPYGIEYNDEAFIGFRAYIDPLTNVGPLIDELVMDKVIKFNK